MLSDTNFCYWLHGWSEINGGCAPNAQQWQIIKDHLDLTLGRETQVARALEVPQSKPNPYAGFIPICTGVYPTIAPSESGSKWEWMSQAQRLDYVQWVNQTGIAGPAQLMYTGDTFDRTPLPISIIAGLDASQLSANWYRSGC